MEVLLDHQLGAILAPAGHAAAIHPPAVRARFACKWRAETWKSSTVLELSVYQVATTSLASPPWTLNGVLASYAYAPIIDCDGVTPPLPLQLLLAC